MDKQFLEATVSIRGVIRGPDDRVLTIRRSSDGGWELPGGRLHRREAVVDCLHREIREETELTVAIRRPVEAVSWQNAAGNDRFAVYYDCATDQSGVTLSDEHTESEWTSNAVACERLSEVQATATRRATEPERWSERPSSFDGEKADPGVDSSS
jgi:8-oxo-dGTP pyrophosphatase MutT (NUDIX family)